VRYGDAIPVDAATAMAVRFAARLYGLTPSQVVTRAVHALGDATPEKLPEAEALWAPVPVYGDYDGTRVEGEYLPATRRLAVRSEPLPGESFKSPSGAARAVVSALNPARAAPTTNGWLWWRVVATNEPLRVYRWIGPP
jgi:hypothetical protein